MKSVVLLTGFEPWGDFDVNPSKDYICTGPRFQGWQTASCVLPVSKKCFDDFDREIALHDPAVIISLGLSTDRSDIQVETRARRGENLGSGPEILKSDLIPATCRLSDDAGEFFCNDLFYYGLLRCRRETRRMSFIHVPANVRFTDIDDVVRELLAESIEGTRQAKQK